ncbi:hypothetical protein [Streptomyces sp. NPDC021356]|uniref:hypothetical protein n=1 Tax=Streptomyces sp. NPDC021356 TaxID=3154900 RepID=UPI00340FB761
MPTATATATATADRRSPNSTNPHLLITRNAATTTTPVGTFWMDRLLKELPVGVDQLRQDLEEVLANGADPLHLARVFSLGAKASLRYTSAVTEFGSRAETEHPMMSGFAVVDLG